MQMCGINLLLAIGVFLALGSPPFQDAAGAAAQASAAVSSITFHAERTSPLDLEVGGELSGVPPGSTRYLTRDDLLALPQSTFTVKNDANFRAPTQVSGVMLDELIRRLGMAPESDMVVAICDDQYRANYPQSYIAEHHPLLVLKVNGQPPSGWPKYVEGHGPEEHGQDMGPYMISHPKFLPSFKVSTLGDEAQIPWGVVRIEVRNEKTVYGAIASHGPHATDEIVQSGYWIARQNCFRCHNNGKEGGTKAGHPWQVLAAWAAASPEYFGAYVRNPKSRNPNAQMPGNSGYSDKNIAALTAYFQTFAPPLEKP
jgi:mono/diheme cytochrome c family protein